MNSAQPAEPSRRDTPTLPPEHPLARPLATMVEVRDRLAELSAQLEYLKLMLRLQQRRS